MNIGSAACFILAFIFGVLSIIFTLLGEKAANLISGFNALTREERKRYNLAKMSADQRNYLLTWAIIMLIGGVLSYFVSQYLSIVAGLLWFILFAKEVKMDTKKAFHKYLIE